MFSSENILFLYSNNATTTTYLVSTRIFAAGGRFPRAWLQSPRRYAPAGLSAHAPDASLSVQKIHLLFPLESPPATKINEIY